MSCEVINAAIAHHTDWPAPGTIIHKMSGIDLPRMSSGTEWWYYNFHLSLVDGRKASAFIAFFRTTSLKPTTKPDLHAADGIQRDVEQQLCHSHLLNFAICLAPVDAPEDPSPNPWGPAVKKENDASEGQYLFTSAMDADNAAYMRSMLEVDKQLDPRVRESLLQVMADGKVPEPDIIISGDVSISLEGQLNLKYGDLASVVCRTNDIGEDVYHIVAQAQDGSYGFELDLIPRKPPISHGANGIVQGDLVTPDDGMYYCFVPRCDVSGSVRIDNSNIEVDKESSMGWYDREFGGGIKKWYEVNTKTTESSWKWASAQLSNGWDLTVYTLWDIDFNSGEVTVRDKRAIAISPEGTRIECDVHSFDPLRTWTSMNTLNDYGTKWKLEIPQLELDVFVEAPFTNQEFRTICAQRGYWEGRVEIAGTMEGKPVNGLGFVENVPGQFVTKFEQYLKRVARLTAIEVLKIYPDRLIDADHAMRILAFQSDEEMAAKPTGSSCLSPRRFTEDMPLDVLYEHLFAPVRHLTDRGGKSWRSYLSVACIAVFGADPEKGKSLLAAMELLHTGSLIIDDIQDESPLRRGVDSVHSIWGVPTAINAGTAAYFAFETAMRSLSANLEPEKKVRIYEIFFETMRAGHAGQALDIAGQQRSDLDDILAGRAHPSVLEKRVLTVHRLKTAIIAGNIAKISSILAGATPAQSRALSSHCERLGIAFQIIDDVYDIRGWSHVANTKTEPVVTSNKKEVLKRRGDDIRSGKISIPIAKAGSMMPLEEAQWVWETVLSKPGTDDITTQKVIDKLESYGIVDACMKEAHKMVDDSWFELDKHLKDNHAKVYLHALGWYLVKYNSI
ncbi:isoprenoid synthase domain-containing protein [Gymnopilus junonius]|uniref:(2E,6E)-farnesyl diphosphate synthase n=1 Tax=Gymnopilus junonius TaxID=109634 RepID=A0A9P5NE05_GYMJU|nr:isoprenoid synthase domain-containing protein [Gymnopilus junonius]